MKTKTRKKLFRLENLLVFLVVLAIIVFVLAIVYLSEGNSLPHTKITLTNTSIVGKILGLG